MILMILGFFFVYWFIIGLYYLVNYKPKSISQEIYDIEPIMSKPSARAGVTIEDAGRIYSNMVDIPIFDEQNNNNTLPIRANHETKDIIKCRVCYNSLPDDSKYCIYCGTRL